MSPRAVDRQPDRRPRGAGLRVRAHALDQRAGHPRRASATWSTALRKRRRRRGRRSREVAIRPGDRPHRLDVAGELRAEARACARHARAMRISRASSARTSRTTCRSADARTTDHYQTATASGSTAASASRKSSGPASLQLRRVRQDLPEAAPARTAMVQPEHVARDRAQRHAARELCRRVGHERAAPRRRANAPARRHRTRAGRPARGSTDRDRRRARASRRRRARARCSIASQSASPPLMTIVSAGKSRFSRCTTS